ncbi:MAG: HEAT repeat domain-containing protein [Kofleriaceae bacterium]|nr:HEAT repeat domain-containing protein [Kofleriaceae bacterium]
MKKLPLVLALLTGLVVSASGHAVMLTPEQRNALTQLDALPSRDQLNSVHANDASLALQNLRDTAIDPADPTVQIRAIGALPQYCGSPCDPANEVHATLVSVVTEPRYRDSRAGTDLLVLRAGIEALGTLRVAEDIDLLIPQLAHPSRDIRAAVAHALRDLGNPLAIDALFERYPVETVPQVQLAIEDALNALVSPTALSPQNP